MNIRPQTDIPTQISGTAWCGMQNGHFGCHLQAVYIFFFFSNALHREFDLYNRFSFCTILFATIFKRSVLLAAISSHDFRQTTSTSSTGSLKTNYIYVDSHEQYEKDVLMYRIPDNLHYETRMSYKKKISKYILITFLKKEKSYKLKLWWLQDVTYKYN